MHDDMETELNANRINKFLNKCNSKKFNSQLLLLCLEFYLSAGMWTYLMGTDK